MSKRKKTEPVERSLFLTITGKDDDMNVNVKLDFSPTYHDGIPDSGFSRAVAAVIEGLNGRATTGSKIRGGEK